MASQHLRADENIESSPGNCQLARVSIKSRAHFPHIGMRRISLFLKGHFSIPFLFFFFFFLRFYLFIQERQRERGRDTGRGRSRLHAGSPTRDSIPGLQDQAPGWRRRSTAEPPGLPTFFFSFLFFSFLFFSFLFFSLFYFQKILGVCDVYTQVRARPHNREI